MKASWSDDLKKAGRSTSEHVLVCSVVRAPAEVSSALEVAADTRVWQVARVIYSVDEHGADEPVIHATSWLSMQVYPEIDRDEIEASSLYRYLQARYGPAARPSTAEEQWSAQAVLRPWLDRNPESYCFVPAETSAWHYWRLRRRKCSNNSSIGPERWAWSSRAPPRLPYAVASFCLSAIALR